MFHGIFWLLSNPNAYEKSNCLQNHYHLQLVIAFSKLCLYIPYPKIQLMPVLKHIFRLFSISTLLIALGINSYGQDVLPTSGLSGPLNGVEMMPEEFRVNLASTKEENVDFYHLTYRTPTIDLRLLKRYTKYNVPESIIITPPDLSAFDHTVVLVGLYGDVDNPTIIIWLGGNYNYRNITFFLDVDQDRNFTNDNPPLKVKEGSDPINIVISNELGEQNLWLSVPKVNVVTKKTKRKIYDQLAIGITAGAGSGSLTYDDPNPSTFHNYHVNISEKHFGLSLSYYSKYFILGLNASYQNHHFYASYDPEPGEIATTSINVNRDLHSPNKSQLGLLTAIRLPLSSFIEFQPTFKLGMANYFNPEYKKNKFSDEAFALGTSMFYEFGVRMEFTVGVENAFFVEIAKNYQDWEPEVFSDSETFESAMKITKFAVGYNIGLFKGEKRAN